MRKLISAKAAAEKLDRSYSWFRQHHDELLRQGFPPPNPHVPGSYDEHAIDLWLDSLMPHHLRELQLARVPQTEQGTDWEQILNTRAEQMEARA